MDEKKSMAQPAEISVIIVNYGTADLAGAAVDSVLQRDHAGRTVDIHLVDNASPGPDRDILSARMQKPAWQDRVIFYPEEVNHGFGRGNNRALQALAARPTPPRYVFLLNPDARLENDAIAILADFLDATPEAGFAGAGISKPETGPVTAAFRLPGFVSECVQTLGFGPVTRLFRHYQVPLSHDHPRGPVGWVAGAAVMARFDMLQAFGFFDPAYFLYFEEVDLMRRAAEKGQQTWYVPEARVVHVEGAATGVRSGEARTPPRPAYWYQSWAHYFHTSQGRIRAAALAICVLGAAVLHFLLARLRGKIPGLPGNFLADFWQSAARPLLAGRSPLAGNGTSR
ncbi:glycosyltransferase family 2 protein [Sedimentitalea sp. HM32M-2]|uniref:glycosyltransferase family 2 protein n=1 Tax=Sedimentitalea sp. HM32M-2 TaxID=3351566 RepID=UPI003640BF87